MKTLQEIQKYIDAEKKAVEDFYYQIELKKEYIEDLEKEIKQTKEELFQENKDKFFKNKFGINYEKEAIGSIIYIIFDRKAKFVKTSKRGIDFKYTSDLEEILKKEKLYAQSASSFTGRSEEWYTWSFRKQLENLGWEFNQNGTLKGIN